jgi:hypothetical protein
MITRSSTRQVAISMGNGPECQGKWTRFPAEAKDFSLFCSLWTDFRPYPDFCSMDSDRGVKLAADFHPVPGLRMHGAIPPLSHMFPSRGP